MTAFRVGQRIRVTNGTVSRTDSGATLRIVNTFADILEIGSEPSRIGALRVRVLPKDAPAIDAWVGATVCESVRGKPFVSGHDDRRKDTSNPDSPRAIPRVEPITAAASTTTTEGETTVFPAPADANAALDILRDALSRPAGTDEKRVREIVAEEVTGRVEDIEETANDAASAANGATLAVLELTAKVDAATAILGTATPAVKASVRAALGLPPSKGNAIADILIAHYPAPATDVLGYPVVLCSPPSLGKTYQVRAFAKCQGYDLYLEHGCSADMDENATLLGTPTPDTEKGTGFTSPDGVLAQAVRAAAAGQTVLLLMDEILRLSHSTQEFILSFLVPRDGRYYLRTRRTVGGALEVISCPTTHLHIVAATNLTGTTNPVEAFWSRWTKRRIPFDKANVQDVSRYVLAAGGVTDTGDTLAALWAEVCAKSRTAYADGTVRFPADIRVLESAAKLSDGTVKSCSLRLAELVRHCANWNDIGDIDPRSVEACTEWTTALGKLAESR